MCLVRGVELLPLEAKIFSGWYGRVAIRRLVGVTDEERKRITEELVRFYNEVSGRPYEQSKLTLILSSAKFIEDALPFLKNRKEDLSSLFCSELGRGISTGEATLPRQTLPLLHTR